MREARRTLTIPSKEEEERKEREEPSW